MYMNSNELAEKRVAREILSAIERIYFGDEYKEYRINYGSNGIRDLLIAAIKDKYDIR